MDAKKYEWKWWPEREYCLREELLNFIKSIQKMKET